MATSRPEDIEYISRLKFGSRFQYVTDHSKEDVSKDNYFHNISQRYLVTGDEIKVVVHHADKTWSKGWFEVVSSDKFNTIVELISPWREGGPKRKPEAPAKRVKPAA